MARLTWPFFRPTNRPSLPAGPPITLMYRMRDSICHSLSFTPLKDRHCSRFSWQATQTQHGGSENVRSQPLGEPSCTISNDLTQALPPKASPGAIFNRDLQSQRQQNTALPRCSLTWGSPKWQEAQDSHTVLILVLQWLLKDFFLFIVSNRPGQD